MLNLIIGITLLIFNIFYILSLVKNNKPFAGKNLMILYKFETWFNVIGLFILSSILIIEACSELCSTF